MTGKVKVQPVSRVGLEPLVAMAEQLRAALPGWEDTAPVIARGQAPSDLALDLKHLALHDGDGFLTVSVGDEVVGFAPGYVRARQLNLAQPWLLPEHLGGEAAEQLIRRALAYGDRSGAAESAAVVHAGAAWQGLLFRFGLRARFSVYRLALAADAARAAGRELAKLLPGSELGDDAIKRRVGSADLERLDRLARGVSRPMDHEHWMAERRLRLAKVRDGQRVAAYAYGGLGQCGPVAAATTEAALAGLGWALQLAAAGDAAEVHLFVPATFETGVEHLLDAGARCVAESVWMSTGQGGALERYVLPSATLS